MPRLSQICELEKDQSTCWNWGIQDDVFYERALKFIETEEQPFFLTLTTVTSHMPFIETPEDQIVHFKNPSGRYENYVNTLTVADRSLGTLVEKIESSN